jgi:hypothetical protein
VPTEPTVNSWAQASHAGTPKKSPPVLVATIAGVLLLVGGVLGAVTFLKPTPHAEPVVAGKSAPPSLRQSPATTKGADPAPVAVADVPVTPKTTPPTDAPAADPADPPPVASVVHAGTKVPTARVSTTLQDTRSVKPEKPKKKTTINFGY